MKEKLPLTDITLTNYSYEFCPREANTSGILIYVMT